MDTYSWSYSSYSTALQCLRKYKYIYIDKLTPVGPESCDLIFGSALHSAINSQLTGQDGTVTFEMYWESYKNKEVEYERFNWEQLRHIGAEFIRKFCKSHAERYQLEFAEKRIYGEYKGILLEGTPDFYGLYQGRVSLRDFKTASSNYKPEKSDTALQLYLYSYLGITKQGFRPETLGYTVFNKALGTIQDLTWEYNEDNMYKALDNMVEYIGTLSTTRKYPKSYNNCLDYNRKCQFYDLCHGGK